MKHDSLNLTAPHTLRELAQAEAEQSAKTAQCSGEEISHSANADNDLRAIALPEEISALGEVGNPTTGEPITLTYRNWRGEVAERTIIPGKVWFGSTDWHPEPQWLLTAFDVEKGADRDFALKDFGDAA